jgi:hypothetical protein
VDRLAPVAGTSNSTRRRRLAGGAAIAPAIAFLLAAWMIVALPAGAGAKTGGGTGSTSTSGFSFGQLQAATVGGTGCGSNVAAEPAIRVSKTNTVALASERSLGQGSDVWRGLGSVGGSGASGCGLTYEGQPNAVSGNGASGGDVDLAIASDPVSSSGPYRIYLASLNLASIAVAHSDDNGASWTNVPVQGGVPGDDRPWIAAFGPSTSLLTFHDIASNNIDVLRSDDGGLTSTQISQAISPTSSAAQNGALFSNQHGNIAIDRINTQGTVAHGPLAGFWAYQSFVSFSASPKATQFNEAYLAVSNDGGFSWTDREVPCSIAADDVGLNNQFPNVSVDPSGRVWMTWSAGQTATDPVTGAPTNVTSGKVYAAVSSDHGASWTCSGQLNANGTTAVMPWLAAASSGADLVYYATANSPNTSSATWSARFQQFTSGKWGSPTAVTTVHRGPVCEGGFACNGDRQLFDDFGVATDTLGFSHIAYSHDAPTLGGSGSWTGSAVQTSGTTVGHQN